MTPASIFFSGPMLNDFSGVSRGLQEQTINKPIMPDLGLDDSNSPHQSPLQTPVSLMIGGQPNMVSSDDGISVFIHEIKNSHIVYLM
jgi:hypothetical protein